MGKPECVRISRRAAMTTGLAGFTGLVVPGFAAGAASVRLTPDKIIARMPEDFTGISVEKVQLSDPTYFDASNTALAALLKRLSPHGILRIGGNSSEFCWWSPDTRATGPVGYGAHKSLAAGIGRADNWMPQSFTAIRPAAVDALRGFLDACGWRCIWGFNFGTATPGQNAAEAAYVAKVLGDRVKYFQIGNEPDFYHEANNRLRPPGWGFEDYLKEWEAHARAILKAVPAAKFGGPDVGASSDWVIRFAREAKPLLGDKLIGLSGHYYASGPPQAKWVTIANLLKSNDAAARRMAVIRPVAEVSGLKYRMTEGNSCYRGGMAGMSDAFASALWGGDYMLAMAANGCVGVNFHCGSGAAIAHSLGGKLPGARNTADLERAKRGAFYAPVAGDLQSGFDARPLYYGMMLAEKFAGADMVATAHTLAGQNGTAYAGVRDGMMRIAVFNKDLTHNLTVHVDIGRKVSGIARQWRLTGPAPDALHGVKFAGAFVAHNTAAWTVRRQSYVPFHDGSGQIRVPRASATLLFLPV